MNETSFLKILYVHGYLGKENGNAFMCLRRSLDKRLIGYTLDAPSFPITNPNKMHEKLNEWCDSKEYDVIIASSMGAFYSMQIEGIKKILVNPAMPKDLLKIKLDNPENNPDIAKELIQELQTEKLEFFDKSNEKLKSESYFIFGANDDIAQNEAFIREKYDETHIFNVEMGHRMDQAGAEKVCDILEILK